MPIVCLGLNHRTAPVNVREQFALPEAKLPELLAALRAESSVEEESQSHSQSQLEATPGLSKPLRATPSHS